MRLTSLTKPKIQSRERSDDPMRRRRRRRTQATITGGDSPSLNSRTKKTRKSPKYLSLRSQLSNPDNNASPRLRHYYTRRNSRSHLQHLKPNQPPLHRPSLLLENCQALDDNVALLFTSSDDATATATLKGLLVDCEDDEEARRTTEGTSGEESVSLRCTYGGSESPLIRSAMKSGYSSHHEGGEDHEEKWVRYSEVVEKEEEVSSNYCTATTAGAGGLLCLSLKLDYQEVLDAWSDKGSLFIRHGIGMDESPQTVPDLCAEFDGLSSGISDWLANVANLWRVPEKGVTGNTDCEDKEVRMRIREASVLRYKEKRHNRLYAKCIRYEVRKLNAEKRPRIKGRFVRRNGKD